ncbi:MAG: 30S ribosomal protein S16 [Chloroflexi bacterium]|jgi:small subunit ribosomal protein S16|nr:30S ribosomal protein S16 [Chloroflexota bacterium]MDP6498142.1 30S ribosomal protein S16 [Dehalococcoidia bacterium]MQG10539.1 30S ribosomal protein S16 [SAR202 cluster bacterium]MQG55199.1 30S ribosomal protein S16 [SAR202 cluster bacterium]|tara:strand:+ start:223 stop:702 length:480 start_codon:yes stop_codon:yes gene_type:complete
MIRIRLARVGKKGHPSYRIVVADITAPRDGSYLEWIGNYDPMADPPAVTLKTERAAHWLSMGAIPSDAVARIMDQNGLMERTLNHSTATKKSGEPENAPAVAPVAVAEVPADDAPADDAPAEEVAPEKEVPAEEPAAEEEPAEEEASEETFGDEEEAAE